MSPDRGRRVLIVNADDYGLTPGVSAGILRAHRHGIVSSTTALAVGPAFAAHAPALVDSGLPTGAHLGVVGEDPPVLSAREVPSLVDEHGRFPLTWKTFVRRAALGRIDPDDLRHEFRAQLDVLRSAGVDPTHIDAHQNLHLWPTVTTVVLELAREQRIPALRLTRTRQWSPTSFGVRTLSAVLERRARRAGMVVPAASTGLDEAGHLDPARLVASIASLAASGAASAELATHPGEADDPDRVRYRWGYTWPDELEALCSPAAREAVRRSGFELGSFAELVEP
ncbi:MAG: ChbG/HpnK family deacetylase [Actinobacteria bacterium]|nr:ChbG/HpnK family deacetylase [Actinomycetota bacterium]